MLVEVHFTRESRAWIGHCVAFPIKTGVNEKQDSFTSMGVQHQVVLTGFSGEEWFMVPMGTKRNTKAHGVGFW